MILYACCFAIGFATGIGAGAYQASLYFANKKEAKR